MGERDTYAQVADKRRTEKTNRERPKDKCVERQKSTKRELRRDRKIKKQRLKEKDSEGDRNK
jgi:hypothetical protein